MFPYVVKIPKLRVPVLIGKKGETKRFIERKTKTCLDIKGDGEVTILSEDNINTFNAIPLVRAIGRGFNPDVALTLLDEAFSLEVLSIPDYVRKTKKDMTRVRARLIGTNGKARRMLEKLTETFISVQGKTVAIVGRYELVDLTKRAIAKLLSGTDHGKVYGYIGREKKKLFARS